MPSVSTPRRRRNVLTSVFRARSEGRVADAGKAPRAPLPAAAFLPRFLLFPNPVSLSRVARLLRREPPGRVGGREVRLRLLGLGRHHGERNFLRFCWFLRSLRPLRVGNRRREIARRSRLVRAERVALDPRRGRRLRRRLGDPRLARHDELARWRRGRVFPLRRRRGVLFGRFPVRNAGGVHARRPSRRWSPRADARPRRGQRCTWHRGHVARGRKGGVRKRGRALECFEDTENYIAYL